MRKPWQATLAILALCALVLAGCANKTQVSKANEGSDAIQVVCTTYPAYDWTMQVLGDEADRYEVTYLLDSGVDLHSYQPTIADMALVSSAALVVYGGGESDAWVDDAIANATNPDLRSISMLEVVGDAAVEEEQVEGMENKDGEEEPELDEHVWLSLRHAQAITDAIANELAAIDEEGASSFQTNAQAYDERLDALDARYQEMVKTAKHDTLVFADRFPFRYLTDDYGLSYYAAFAGCSAETEASFETVRFLAQKLDELGLKSVLVIDGSDQKIAKTVIDSTTDKDQQILVLDSLQSTRAEDIQAGKTYLGAMEANLEVLRNALA